MSTFDSQPQPIRQGSSGALTDRWIEARRAERSRAAALGEPQTTGAQRKLSYGVKTISCPASRRGPHTSHQSSGGWWSQDKKFCRLGVCGAAQQEGSPHRQSRCRTSTIEE